MRSTLEALQFGTGNRRRATLHSYDGLPIFGTDLSTCLGNFVVTCIAFNVIINIIVIKSKKGVWGKWNNIKTLERSHRCYPLTVYTNTHISLLTTVIRHNVSLRSILTYLVVFIFKVNNISFRAFNFFNSNCALALSGLQSRT
ncbi:hypothetical protein Salat_2158400 [Sesamum alatum]|uniref:Uncharacterized protein n=1 Tax=Sesamum alatum TaxID=300844 RepID=A0AAE2CHD1_9LAMI|nr:hypothetical protein Salat_2158400 [Sesamum alatum]